MASRQASQFNTLTNPYVDQLTSVSGSDIVGVFGHVEFTQLQGLSVSVNREIHPIYVMGRTDPSSFVRGKRGVAGSIVAVCSDRGALFDITERFGVHAKRSGNSHIATRQRQGDLNRNALSELDRLGYVLATPVYYDQLPPFDATLIGRSESMGATISRVGGIFIVSMGTGMSVDDNSIEQQMTFVALYYEDWRPAGHTNVNDFDRAATDEEVNPFAASAQGQDIIDSTAVEQGDVLGQRFGLSPQ